MKKRTCLLADENRGLEKQEVADVEGKGVTSGKGSWKGQVRRNTA